MITGVFITAFTDGRRQIYFRHTPFTDADVARHIFAIPSEDVKCERRGHVKTHASKRAVRVTEMLNKLAQRGWKVRTNICLAFVEYGLERPWVGG